MAHARLGRLKWSLAYSDVDDRLWPLQEVPTETYPINQTVATLLLLDRARGGRKARQEALASS